MTAAATTRRSYPLFRPAQADRPAGVAPAFGVAYIVLAAAAYAWTTATGGLAVLWLCNGLVAAALLVLPREKAIAVAVVGLLTDFLCSFLVGGNSVALSAVIATIDLSEAVAAATLARRVGGAALDVTRPVRLFRIIALAILPATMVAGTVGAMFSQIIGGISFADQWVAWALGDFMSMSIALPSALIISRARGFTMTGTRALLRLAVIVAILLGTAAVFAQQEILASVLLIVMALLLATFALGPSQVALTIVGIAIVAAGLTISGHGPIAVDEPMDIGRRILILQMFGMTVSISALTATALVAEQGRVQRSLRRSLAGARAARQRAMTAAAAKARFLATMSHEMRTPLNGIQGSVRGLEGEPGLSSAARARLSAIRTSSEALNCLIDDVLDFSQLDSAQLALDPSPTDVVGLVQGVAAMGRALIGAKPLDIAVVADAPAGQFHMLDARRLSQAILHLVTNAVKFSDRGEIRMTVSLSVGEGVVDTWRIAVADRGVGVPPEQLEEIFAPFHQADGSTTRRHGGAGLGLAISRELVSLMGGRMGAANRPEGGAEFWIETPALRAEAPPAIEPVETRPPRVLVVDDHVMNLEVARVYLEAYGCEIVCCEDGAAAVNAVAHDTFDMVFMDIHMPVMDGLEATRAIRMLASPHADTPIVALTAAATAADVSACLQAGMNAHLSKPIRGERLAEALMRFGRWDGDIASAA